MSETTWYETKSFALYSNDTPAMMHYDSESKEVALREKLVELGWETDPGCTDGNGYVYVRRAADFERLPEGELSGFASLRHIAETVKGLDESLGSARESAGRVDDNLKNLQQRADTAVTDIKGLAAEVGSLRDDFAPHGSKSPGLDCEPCRPTSSNTGPLADEIDYEACGAPWTLTIEGGRRR